MSECKYCLKKFKSAIWNKKFCCYSHMTRWTQLKNIKESFRLDDEEKKIWSRARYELLNSNRQKKEE